MSEWPYGSVGYDAAVMALGPVGYWKLSETSGTVARDLSGHGRDGTYQSAENLGGDPALEGGPPAAWFDGEADYVTVPDSDAFSVTTTGGLTVMVLVRPDSLDMPNTEGSGYVHFLGKGASNNHEWAFRMYQESNTEGRANRICFYVFNLSGGLGVGESFQDALTVGEWIHVVGTLDATTKTIAIYKNGVLRQADPYFGEGAYAQVDPGNGTAPLRIGTRNVASFWKGSIGNVAVIPRCLTAQEISDVHRAIGGTP